MSDTDESDDYKQWAYQIKHEEYSIYNDYWRNHFEETGRILVPKRDTACEQAREALKPAKWYTSPTDTMDMVWLNGRPSEPEPEDQAKPVIDTWSQLFDSSEPQVEPSEAKPSEPSEREMLGLRISDTQEKLESVRRRKLMTLYAQRRKGKLSDSDARLLEVLEQKSDLGNDR